MNTYMDPYYTPGNKSNKGNLQAAGSGRQAPGGRGKPTRASEYWTAQDTMYIK